MAEDPLEFDGGDTNLYGYVGNNPVNWVDPFGLYYCAGNAVCDFTDEMDQALQCFDRCTHRNTCITSGRDSHPADAPHSRGEAVDIGRNHNRDLTRGTADECWAQCFSSQSYAQEKRNAGLGTHFHFQTVPLRNGETGFPLGVQPHGRAR